MNVLEELEEKVIAVMLLAPQWRLAVKAWRGAMKKGVHAGKLTAVIAKAAGGRGAVSPTSGRRVGSMPMPLRGLGRLLRRPFEPSWAEPGPQPFLLITFILLSIEE